MSAEPRTFVIGDVHGHVDRLAALLEQEGIVNGDGRRINRDVRVIQLGDLGHYGWNGDPDGDAACWQLADEWLDLVLWGNHDRAVVDFGHGFAGYTSPGPATVRAIHNMVLADRVAFAAAAHGRLLTHAGVHPAFDDELPEGLDDVVEYLNGAQDRTIVTAVSPNRGGRHLVGGILWRDYEEPLSTRWPQVYGHTRGETVRHTGASWCIDIGHVDNGRLAGLWLPDEVTADIALGSYTAAHRA